MPSYVDLLRQLAALAGTPGATQKLTDSAGSSQRSSALPKHKLYYVCGDQPFYIKLGDGSVTATNSDQYWPSNTPIAIYTGENTNIAILRSTGTTTNVSITAWDVDPQPLATIPDNQYGS